MTPSRRWSLTLLTAIALTWAVLLTVGGLWLAIVASAQADPGWKPMCVIGGLTALAGGQLVFLVCIADRIFPRAARGVTWTLEIPTCVMLLAGFGLMLAHAGRALIGA